VAEVKAKNGVLDWMVSTKNAKATASIVLLMASALLAVALA